MYDEINVEMKNVVCTEVNIPNVGCEALNICLRYVISLSLWFLADIIKEESNYVTWFTRFIRLK